MVFKKNSILHLLIFVSILAIDQIMKWVPGIQVTANPGMAIALGADSPWQTVAAAHVAMMIAAAVLLRGRVGSVGFCVLFAGATSNLLDRLFVGCVLDYLRLGNFSFNLADLAIVFGALHLTVSLTRGEATRGFAVVSAFGVAVLVFAGVSTVDSRPLEAYYRTIDGNDFSAAWDRACQGLPMFQAREIVISPRFYPHAHKAKIRCNLDIRGSNVGAGTGGVGAYSWRPGISELRFLSPTDGGVFFCYSKNFKEHAATDNTDTCGAGESASVTRMRDVVVMGPGWNANGNANGLEVHSAVQLENITIRAFPGVGLHVSNSVGGSATGHSLGNSNGMRVRGMQILQVGRHGVLLSGGDANASIYEHVSVTDVGGKTDRVAALNVSAATVTSGESVSFVVVGHNVQKYDLIQPSGFLDATGVSFNANAILPFDSCVVTATTSTTVVADCGAMSFVGIAEGDVTQLGTIQPRSAGFFLSPLIDGLFIAPRYNGSVITHPGVTGINYWVDASGITVIAPYAEGAGGSSQTYAKAGLMINSNAPSPVGSGIRTSALGPLLIPSVNIAPTGDDYPKIHIGGQLGTNTLFTIDRTANETSGLYLDRSSAGVFSASNHGHFQFQVDGSRYPFMIGTSNNSRLGAGRMWIPGPLHHGGLDGEAGLGAATRHEIASGTVGTTKVRYESILVSPISGANNATPSTISVAHGLGTHDVAAQDLRCVVRNIGGVSNAAYLATQYSVDTDGNGTEDTALRSGVLRCRRRAINTLSLYSLDDTATAVTLSGTYVANTGQVSLLRAIGYGDASPATGTWMVGDRVNSTVATTTGDPTFWICTASGAPGTWVGMDLIP